MRRLISLIMGGMLLVAVANGAFATDVFGPVSGVWTIQGSPYYVVDSVYVPTDSTLIIEAGVEVIFWGHFKFGVHPQATLRVYGVEGDSVRFTTPWLENGWWGMHFVHASPACSLAYCVFEYGRAVGGSFPDYDGAAIYCSYSSPSITHSRFSYCRAEVGGAIYLHNESYPYFEQCTFSADTASNDGGAIYCGSVSPEIANCTFVGNRALDDGAAIYLYDSDASIHGNVTAGNFANDGGGGIVCTAGSVPMISDNVMTADTAGFGGAIYVGDNSPAIISGNTITAASANSGGAIYSSGAVPRIRDNVLVGNWANYGGAIYCSSSDAIFAGNTVRGNWANYNGGAIFATNGSTPDLDENEFSDNHALGYNGKGGALYVGDGSSYNPLDKNTFYGNSATYQGGAMYLYNATLYPKNSIFWQNTAPNGAQIYLGVNSGAIVTFSDVQGGWPGSGNLNLYPLFADTSQNDYHLLAGSPCIDHGDPHPEYNDPDFTPADMGCYYFEQPGFNPLTLEATPVNPPIQIPFYGDVFEYIITISNTGIYAQMMWLWCEVTLPWGAIYGPVMGPVEVSVGIGATLSSQRMQAVPNNAPAGNYLYWTVGVVELDTLSDSFPFEKLSPGDLGAPAGGAPITDWWNSGDPLREASGNEMTPPANFVLHPNYPNPFNATTSLGFDLPEAGWVRLAVYDLTGRKVADVVDGWRDAGAHRITLNASGLAAGIYICRLETDHGQAAVKMILLK